VRCLGALSGRRRAHLGVDELRGRVGVGLVELALLGRERQQAHLRARTRALSPAHRRSAPRRRTYSPTAGLLDAQLCHTRPGAHLVVHAIHRDLRVRHLRDALQVVLRACRAAARVGLLP